MVAAAAMRNMIGLVLESSSWGRLNKRADKESIETHSTGRTSVLEICAPSGQGPVDIDKEIGVRDD